MAGNWPLIGRDDEMAQISQVFDRPHASGIVLVGPAGVGKTRLATESLHLATERGFASTRVVSSRAASGIPFGALATLLPSGTTAIEQGLTALRQVTLALSQLAAGRRLVLVVDDAHSLDDASAVLLEQLASTQTALLVVTLRSGETPPEPITALWKDHGLERITIHPLSRTRADHFAMTMLGDDVDQGTLAALWEKTEGNPMYLRELVLGAVNDGALVCTRGRWQAVGELTPSDRLSELVGIRLTGLDSDELSALEYVAFGEPLGFEMLAGLSDADNIETLERNGLIVLHNDGRRNELRLAHPMYGEVLRARTPAVRARAICRRLADAAERTGTLRRSDPLRVSLWRLDGGGVPPIPLLLAGAAQALFAYDHPIAHRLARTAFELQPRYSSGLMLLQVQYSADLTADSPPLFALMRELAENDRDRAWLAVMEATSLFWKSGDMAGADRVMAEALDTLSESVERDWIIAFRALVDVQAGNPRLAIERTDSLMLSTNIRTFVRAALSGSLAVSIVGRCLDAVELAERAIAARMPLGDELALFESGLLLVAKSVALNEAGQITEAYETAKFTRLLAADANDISSLGFCGIALARICMTAGRLGEAAECAADAITAFRRYGHPGPLRWAYGYLGLAHAQRGELHEAADALDELGRQPPHPAAMLDIDIERAWAWRAIGEGHLEDGRAILTAAALQMRRTGQIGFEAAALFDLARLGVAREVTGRLTEIAGEAQGELYPAMAAGAAALASGDAAELEAAAETFAGLGAALFAAELAVATSEGWRRDGDQRRAAEWSRRAAALLTATGGARTPGLLHADTPIPLTQRERDVALLAAQGLSSKVIGERLFVASRTVDNHLARIYAKLGVTGRVELAEVLTADATRG
jgi:ATP/maltotriose-dependent transcriptional regulator MalT